MFPEMEYAHTLLTHRKVTPQKNGHVCTLARLSPAAVGKGPSCLFAFTYFPLFLCLLFGGWYGVCNILCTGTFGLLCFLRVVGC